jgi:hypothetical protein
VKRRKGHVGRVAGAVIGLVAAVVAVKGFDRAMGTESLQPASVTAAQGVRAHEIQPSTELVACAKGPLAGCSRPQIEEYAKSALGLVRYPYIDGLAGAGQKPPVIVWVPTASSANKLERCGNWLHKPQAINSRVFFYCTYDNTFYIGEGATWDMYNKYGGQFLMPFLAAHELTHYLQHNAGIAAPSDGTVAQEEHQADCGAGAWLAFALKHGLIDSREDVVGEATNMFREAEKVLGKSKLYGSPGDRERWFLTGTKIGMAGCARQFFPDHPIVK